MTRQTADIVQPEQGPADYDAPQVRRAIALLRHIAKGNRCRNVARTAAELGINRTTLLRLLHTLERESMIEQDRDGGGYSLSYGLLELTAQARASSDIARIARPLLARLSQDIGLSAHLGVLSGTEVVVLVRETPRVALVSNVHEGSRLPAHATVMGRIILAHTDRAEVHGLLSAALQPITSLTPVTLSQLDRVLEQDRSLGIAWSVANYEPGIGSCAVAILDRDNRPVAAISLAGPQAAFENEAPGQGPISRAVSEVATQLSLSLRAAG